jgi:hypothetical protein
MKLPVLEASLKLISGEHIEKLDNDLYTYHQTKGK